MFTECERVFGRGLGKTEKRDKTSGKSDILKVGVCVGGRGMNRERLSAALSYPLQCQPFLHSSFSREDPGDGNAKPDPILPAETLISY